MSKRKDEAFIAIDLGSLVPTLFESELFGHKKGAFTDAKQDKTGWIQLADGGTVFLDEIANTEPTQQTKLLHVLQNKIITPVGSNEAIPVSTRFIAATNDDLLQRVQKGSFREDLLYRLNTITLTIPPLRERKEDIPELVDFYLKKYQHKYGKKISSLSSHTLERLKNYAWPGNIRELSHCIERAVILSQNGQPDFADFCIHTNSLHKNHDSKPTYNLQELEKDAVKKAIREAQGNYSKAAELLGISRKTLYNKISKYGL
jgi:DNA-binding NtrC family response regulator